MSSQVYVQVRIDGKYENRKSENKENPKHIIERVLTEQDQSESEGGVLS